MKRSPFSIAALAVVMLMAVSWSPTIHAQTQTSRAMMVLSSQAADQKAKDDLLSILQPAGKFSKGNRIAVSGISMRTIPHGTAMKGLCALDNLFLHYTATGVKADAMNEPERPVGLSVTHFYHAMQAAMTEDDWAAILANVWSRDCKKLQSAKDIMWFQAENDTEAAKAVNTLAAAMEALRSGKSKAAGCDFALRNGESCAEAIVRLGRVNEIETMGHDCLAGPGKECFTLYVGEAMAINVVASFDGDAIVPKEIFEVGANTYTVVD